MSGALRIGPPTYSMFASAATAETAELLVSLAAVLPLSRAFGRFGVVRCLPAATVVTSRIASQAAPAVASASSDGFGVAARSVVRVACPLVVSDGAPFKAPKNLYEFD